MDILGNIVTAVITAIITTLVINFFLQRMTENAKKPWMTQHHQQMIDFLRKPNALAVVQLPNAGDQIYEVTIMPINHRITDGGEDRDLAAFDVMMEEKIVLPIDGQQRYRLSRSYRDKYRKPVLVLAYEEFGVKRVVGLLRKFMPFRKRGNSIGNWE